jgi:hypothetical protein
VTSRGGAMPDDDAYNTSSDQPFDVDDLLNHGVIFEEARTLLISDDGGGSKSVLFILGDHYTMWTAAAFRAWAARLLKQL